MSCRIGLQQYGISAIPDQVNILMDTRNSGDRNCVVSNDLETMAERRIHNIQSERSPRFATNGAALLLGSDRATMQSFWHATHSVSISPARPLSEPVDFNTF